MKNYVIAVAALAAFVSAPASAADTDFTLSGTVAASCSTGLTGDSKSVTFSDATATTFGDVAFTSSSLVCNGLGTNVSVTKTDMTTAATAPAGFAKTVTFTPEVKLTNNSVVTDLSSASGTVIGAVNGTLAISAKSLTSTAPLIAGSYSGKITVTVTPAS